MSQVSPGFLCSFGLSVLGGCCECCVLSDVVTDAAIVNFPLHAIGLAALLVVG